MLTISPMSSCIHVKIKVGMHVLKKILFKVIKYGRNSQGCKYNFFFSFFSQI